MINLVLGLSKICFSFSGHGRLNIIMAKICKISAFSKTYVAIVRPKIGNWERHQGKHRGRNAGRNRGKTGNVLGIVAYGDFLNT